MWNQVKTRVEICQGRAAQLQGCLEMMMKLILGGFGKIIFKEGHEQGYLEDGYDNFIILKYKIN